MQERPESESGGRAARRRGRSVAREVDAARDARMGRLPFDEGPSPEASGAQPDWRRWLAAGNPREILGRIVKGDPLRLRPTVATALRARWLLLDADRVQLRALALCARFGADYRGRPPLADWLAQQVDRAIDELLEEEAALPADGDYDRPEDVHVVLARPLGLPGPAMRRACVAFNACDAADRRAFFALLIELRDLDSAARQEGVTGSEIGRRARRALDAALGVATEQGRTE